MKNKKQYIIAEIKNYIALIFFKVFVRHNKIKISADNADVEINIFKSVLSRRNKNYKHVSQIKADDFKKMKMTALIFKDESGWYCGQIQELPGVFSQGKTQRELLENLKDALKLVFEDEIVRAAKKIDKENLQNMDDVDKVIKPFKLNKKEEKIVFEIIENVVFKKVKTK